ncbi:MAG: hypothetical protein KDB27_10560 [Planctomycetales bacterium]|nr:hypothetical protein [Planctomycetales bacterium]
MNHRCYRRLPLLLAAVVLTTGVSIPRKSDAGPLLDWLFRRRNRTVAYSPIGGCCGGAAYCEQTVVNYIPQTSYRTVWQPVPVTTYRQTTHCNPTTGLPITCTRPCTTYTYQARRVPYTSYRPVYSKVPVSMPTQSVNYLPAASSGCSSCSTGYSSVPDYGSAGYSIPSSRDYSSSSSPGATPWTRIDDNRGRYDEQYRSDDPADQRPTLPPRGSEPEIERSGYSRALQRIPSSRQTANRYDSDYRESDRYYDRNDRDYDRYGRGGYERDSADRSRSEISESARRSRGTFRSDDTTSRYARIERDIQDRPFDRRENEYGSSVLRQRETERSYRDDLQPVPNAAPSTTGPRKELPPLLNPTNQDREASVFRPIATRWASNKIYWNEIARVQRDRSGETAVRHASAEEPVSSRTRQSIRRDANSNDRWERQTPSSRIDDSGWSSGKR